MERKDFGEENVSKYFLTIAQKGGQLSFTFVPLPVRQLHDLTVDQSTAASGALATQGAKEWLAEYANKHDMVESIVRLTIFVNEKALFDMDKDSIRLFVRKVLKANNCVSIHTHVVSERQLRKSTITEKNDPRAAFCEFLELVDDADTRRRMHDVGLRIIEERGRK
jgi:hypothetical protein